MERATNDDKIKSHQKFQELLKSKQEVEDALKNNILQLTKEIECIQNEKDQIATEKFKLNSEYNSLLMKNEEEVSLRAKFDAKMNTLNSQYKTLNSKCEQLAKANEELIQIRNSSNELIESLRNELDKHKLQLVYSLTGKKQSSPIRI
jgi:outer membrane murein-binding lipoprotein Lpp